MRKLIILLLIFPMFYSCESIEKYRKGYKEETAAREKTRRKPYYKAQTQPKFNIIVVKHPDLNFPPTDPAKVVIYEGFKPLNDKYIVVGKMGIIENTIENSYRKTTEIKKKAADIGGQAVIIVDAGTKTEEYGGNIVSGISIPRYFWWDFYPYYMGTDYYWYKSPKMTVATSYRIGLIIKWIGDVEELIQRFDYLESEMERLKENYLLADKKEAWAFIGMQYVKEKGMHVGPGDKIPFFAILEDKEIKLDVEQAMLLSHHKNLDENLAKFKEDYPLALKEDVWDFLRKKDDEGNKKYSVEEAIEFSHQINFMKPEIAKLKKIYPFASCEEVLKSIAKKTDYSIEEQKRIFYTWKFIENEIAELKKKFSHASEEEVWKLLLEKDEESNYKNSIALAVVLSHFRNLKKK